MTIFITGASRGLGRLWAEAFLNRGDKVVATSRNIKSLQGLTDQYGTNVFLPLELDITDRAACFAAMEKSKAQFGTIDVVINNAAMGLNGMIEELEEEPIKDLINANFFGTLWVTQAAIPVMRAQGHGHILQLSSAVGIYSFPTIGIYSASKFAVEGFTEALYQEVKDLGIHVTILQPNGFATDFGSSAVQSGPNPAYEKVRTALYQNPAITEDDAYGDPKATVAAIFKLLDSPEPPLRLILGKKALPLAEAVYQQRLGSWQQWNAVSVAAHGL